jgi:hypothetical protein
MSFADPQSITVNAVAKSMPRISTNGTSAVYQMPDESFKLTISHQKSAGRLRSVVRVDQRVVAADPLTSVNDWQTLGLYVVLDRPMTGFTQTQVDQLWTGFKAFLDSSAMGKVYGTES